MSNTRYSAEDVAARGEALYDQELRQRVEPGNEGKYLVIDVDTGDYELGENYLELTRQLRSRRPDAAPYALRIGHRALGRIGGRRRA